MDTSVRDEIPKAAFALWANCGGGVGRKMTLSHTRCQRWRVCEVA